jgi:hypothetical protein
MAGITHVISRLPRDRDGFHDDQRDSRRDQTRLLTVKRQSSERSINLGTAQNSTTRRSEMSSPLSRDNNGDGESNCNLLVFATHRI